MEESKVDYVAIARMLVNPLNPYSWFLYFFVAIHLYASTQQWPAAASSVADAVEEQYDHDGIKCRNQIGSEEASR